VQDQITAIAGRSDVQKSQFIGALVVVARGNFNRVTGIAQLQEINAFDNPTAGDVKTRNDSFSEHGG
jgi:hypothetical protein